MAGQIVIQGQLTGIPLGYVNVGPFTIVANAGNNLEVLTTTLTIGYNSFTVPTWAVGVIIEPSVTNAVAMTLKGATGDTGQLLSLTSPTILSYPATPPATIGIYSVSAASTITTITFF